VHKPNDSVQTHPSSRQSGYAEWIALGAVAAGTVGAIVGMATCRNSAARSDTGNERMDPEMVTAPHGDTLKGAVV
jgi:hypothetical protein